MPRLSTYITALLFVAFWVTGNFLLAQNVVTERIYTQVDGMPQHFTCGKGNDNMYKISRCTQVALKDFFAFNMEYPSAALETGSEGLCLYNIVIDTTGAITDIKAVKTIPAFENESKRLMEELKACQNFFQPGRQGRRKVKVSIQIPVTFELAAWKKESDRRKKLQEMARQDSLLKLSQPVDSLPKK